MRSNPTGELGVDVKIVDLSVADEVKGAVAGKTFTHVFDNYAKDVATCTMAASAREWGVKSFVYVSSAGMYKSDVPQPMKEDGSVAHPLHHNSYAWESFTCVLMCSCIHATHVRINPCTDTHVYLLTQVPVQPYTHVPMQLCIQTNMFLCTLTYPSTLIRIHACTCTLTNACAHLRT